MRVLLINISLRPKSEKIIFPVGLSYIATAIYNAGFDLVIYDLDVLRPTDKEIEEYIKNVECDMVAMGCIVTGYQYVKKICEIIKKYKKVPIIVGNSVSTSIPEILLKKTKADIGVMGEGDYTIVELLKAFERKIPLDEVRGIFFRKNNDIFFTEERVILTDLSELPMIKYDLFDMKVYLQKCKYNVAEPYPIEFGKLVAFPVNTARGCLFNCTFCYHVFKKKKYRSRPIKKLLEEIKYLQENYGINYIQFWDELTLYSKEQAEEFAGEIIQSGLKFWWVADCRAGLFEKDDLELALRLKEAGCVSLGCSLESADEDILKEMNKHITVEQFTIQTRILQKVGIITETSLVIGYPQETVETLQKTFDVCYELGIYPSVGYLLPQPSTPMYQCAKEKGLIKDEEEYLLKMGDRQDFRINLTKNLTRDQMEKIVMNNLKRIAQKMKLRLNEENLIKTGHSLQVGNAVEK